MTLESGGKTNFLMKTARHCITQKIAKETCYCIWQNFGYYWENPSNFQIISPIFCDAFYLQENLEKNYHHLANCVVNVLHINFFKPFFSKSYPFSKETFAKKFSKNWCDWMIFLLVSQAASETVTRVYERIRDSFKFFYYIDWFYLVTCQDIYFSPSPIFRA